VKKLLIISAMLSSSYLLAYTVKFKTGPNHDGTYMYSISCNNGISKNISYNPNGGITQYFYNSHAYQSLKEAASYACSTNKIPKTVYIKKGTLICTKEKEMRSALTSENVYAMRKHFAKMGGDCFISSSGTFKFVKEHTLPRDSYIDNYFEIASKYETAFVRKNEIN